MPIRAAHTNSYKKRQLVFIVQDLKELNVGCGNNEVWKIKAVLKLKRPYLDPEWNIYWMARFRNWKLERPGPPNQYLFSNKQKKNKKKS